MTPITWPEEDLRQAFYNTTFKGLKMNLKPVKEEMWRTWVGQLTECLRCYLQNYSVTGGRQLSSSFVFEGQITLNILENTLL